MLQLLLHPPIDTPVTTCGTLAIAGFDDVHVTVLSVALFGSTDADKATVPRILIVLVAGDTVILVTGIAATVTVAVPTIPLPSFASVIVTSLLIHLLLHLYYLL